MAQSRCGRPAGCAKVYPHLAPVGRHLFLSGASHPRDQISHMCVSFRRLCLPLGRMCICISCALQKDVGLQCLTSAADSTAAAAWEVLLKGTRLQRSRPPSTRTQGPVMKFMRNVRVQGGTGNVV